MYFNRKNAEQKNWRMIKKGKHFLFGCSLVFAVGAALVAPSVKADTVEAKPDTSSTTEGVKPVVSEENPTYAAPAVEVAPATAEEKAEKPVETTQNSKEEPVVATEKAKEADSIQAPEVTVVYNPSALTDEEKAKVVAAVKAANPTATDVQVQADGSVVVIFADGSSANLSAAQTIKDGSLVAKPRTNRAARATAPRASEGAENLDYSNKEDVEGYVKISYEVDKANNVIHWTVLDNPGRKGNSASGYVYFTIPKYSVGEPTNWKVVQTDKNGKVVNSRDYWKNNDGSYLMGQKGRMNTYTGAEMTKRLTQLYKDTKNPAIKGNEAAVAAQTAERSQALYTMTADNNSIRNVMWTITYDTPILDKSKPLDYVAGMQGTGLVGGRTNIMTGFTDNYIDNASSKFQAVAVKEKYTAKVGGSFAADPATYVTNKAGTPEFPNSYRGATSFKWKDGQAPTATEAGTYTKTVVVTYPAHYKQAPQEVTITFEVEGETPKPVTPAKPVVNTDLTGKAGTKTSVEVTADPGTTVELFDKDNNKIGEATADNNGKATITPTVDIPAGAVTAKATKDGQTSVASDPVTATTPAAPVVAPTVEIPYSNKDAKEVYVYAGEENSFDIKFKDDSGKIASATVNAGGNQAFKPVEGEENTINTQYGFKANVISAETPATADAPAVITYRGTPAATDGLKPEDLEAATKGENPKGMVLGWRYATATDTDGAKIENKAVGSSNATDPGSFRVILKPQNQKYDIATPTEKVTVADPANVTEAELAKIKEKVQLEYSQNNDDANLADKKGTTADKTNKIQSVTKDADGNLVVTYTDGSIDKKPLSEFVNVAPTVELPYSNQAKKQIYVYTGENTDLTFKGSDETEVKNLYLRGPGIIAKDNTAGFGFTTGKIENSAVTHGEGTVSGKTATIKMTGVTNLKSGQNWTSFIVAEDNDNALSNDNYTSLREDPNALTRPGYVQFVVKSQADKYDIATPADKVEVADPANVTEAELAKIKKKVQLEYSQNNDDANLADKKGTAVADKDAKIKSIEKDADGNLVVTYKDGSQEKKPLSEFVTKKPTTPTQPEITTDLTGKAGTKTPVEVTAEPGTKVELFDKDGNKIGEATAGADGKAKITPTVDIPEGNVTAKATKDGQTSDASAPKEATAATPTTPTQPEITTDLTGKAGTKTPVEVTAEPGTKVELFDKDGNKIGEATAGADGKAKITPTVDIPEGNVTAKATKDGQTSDASAPKEATAATPTTPTQPEITTDLTGKAGTKTPVEVTAEPGTKVELFDKDGNKIGEATAGADGKAKITPTVDIPEGNVTAKATKDGQTSDASAPKEATAATPTTPTQPEITTDLTGKAGTKTPVEVTAEPGTKVELFDKDGNKIGEATAGADGKAKITPTVDIPEGNVTAKATKDGQTSDASAPKEATAATPTQPEITTDLTGKAGTKTPVEVTAEPGTKVELFDKDGNKIGEATAGADGKAKITPTVDIPAGNVTAKATKDGQTSDASAPKEATAATPTTPTQPEITTDLTGKAGTKTPVEVTAEPGTKVELFDKDGNKIGEATAGADGKAKITPTVDIPEGNVTAKATKDGQTSDASAPKEATAATPTQPEITTDLTGKAGTKTPVEVTAEPGTKVELFDKDGNKIGEATAGADGKAKITPTVDIPAGNVTAKATKDGQTSDASAPKEATAATPTTPTQPEITTDLTGKAGTKTPVEVTAEPGTKVELFDKDGNKIGEATAGADGKAKITPTVDIPAGNVTAKATKDGQTSDASAPKEATAATPTTPTQPEITTDLTGKAGTKTPVEVTAEPGTKVELFDKDGNKIGEATAGADGKAKITPTVDIPEGKVTAKATKDGQTSDASAPKEATAATPTTPTQPEITTDLTGKAGTKTPVEVTAEPGTKVELFDKDGNKIGEATAGADGKAKITPTVDIPEGNVTAKATKDGQTSDASAPKEATAATPTQPEITTDLTGKAGTKTPVEVTAEPGSKVEMYDKDGNKIGEATADENGKATITPTVDIPEGNVTVVATKDGQTPEASDPVPATTAKDPATPAKPSKPVVDTDLTGKAGTKTPVEVTAEPGTKVELFDKDGNKIGEGTADNNGKVTITPTVDIPAGNVIAKATKDGQTSDASAPKEATAATPTTPTQPEITTDLTGKAGTKTPVEVTAEPGSKVEMYDKDGNKIGEATADENGKAKITPTVDIPEGNVTVVATKDGQTPEASDPVPATTAKDPATPAKPSKPVVDTDLTGKAGTKTPVEVTAEPGTKVELFDKDGNKIGEAATGANGKAIITPTVDIPAGNVTAKATKDGQTSEASAPKVATAATPTTPTQPEITTDLTGKAGTKTPVEVTAEPGSKVEMYDKDGNKIGEATADENGKAKITPTVDIPEGNVTVVATKDGQTPEASDPVPATPAKDAEGVKDPEAKTPVKDPANLTDAEKAKVADEVKKANPTAKDVEVGKDGTTTVTFPDGSTAEIPAAKTVEKAKDAEGVKDPEAKTPVKDPANLTDAEKAKVAEEVKKANPTAKDVEVGKDGTTTVTFPDGSTAEIPAAKTVEKAKDAEGVKDPEAKTPVKDPANLTDAEKARVADEVKKANPTAKDVEVGKDGTTTVIFPDGSKAEIPAAKTVEKAKDAEGVKDPEAKTPVKDPANLTDAEKAKVAEEVKKANPTAKDVEVGKDGTTTVTFPDGSKAVIPADKTVKKSDDKVVTDPAVTPVTDPSNLTDAEKAKVADEVKKSNPTVSKVEVGNDGTATVTYPDGTTAVIPADKTVKKSDDKVVTDPSVTPVTDPSNLTDAEKAKVADEVKKSNPTVSKVEVGNDGTTTVTYPDGTTAVIPADKTVKKSDDKAVKDPAVTPVTDPSNLTDAEKAKVADEVKKANPTAKDVEVGKDGTTTVTFPDGSKAEIPATKTVKKSADKAVKDPSVTPVTDPSNLTDAEKAKVADEVKKANPTAKDVEVGKDGTTTVTFPDGSKAEIPAAKTVKKSADKAVKDPTVTPVTDPSNLTDAEKAKVADEVKKANPTVTDVKVDKDGTTTVTYPDGTTAVIPADKTVKKSADKAVKDPSVTPVTDPSNLTDAEKAKVADEVKKSNPTVTDVKVDKDGTTTVTYPDGTTAVIPADKTVKKSDDKVVTDPTVTPVTDPSNLTDAEKAKVAEEVKKSNPTVTDVKVDKDGTTTVTYPDGTTAVIPADKTVKKSSDKELKVPAVTPVTDPSNLTDAEKAKVVEEVKKANPTVTDVKVDKDGTTTVTYPDGTTAVIPADKTVKESADKELNDPAVTPVTDPSNLTDAEKAKVADEVKKANPTVTDVTVGNDGTATVTYPDGTTAVIPADKTVKKSADKDVKDPAVTPVVDPSNLTDAEKAKVVEEVKKANPTVTDVTVGNDGTATITYPDGKTTVIPADKTVKKSSDKVIKDPVVTPVVNQSNLTVAEKVKVTDEVKKANPTVTDIAVGNDGTATVTYPDGTTAVIPSEKTVKELADKELKDPSVTPVTDPSNLTDAEKGKVAEEVKKSNPTVTDVKVDEDGTTTVTYPDGTTAVIPADKTVKKSDDKVVKDPSVTPVTDPSNLTDAEKAKVAEEVKKSNPTVTDVKVDKDGTTTVTYPDGTTAVIPADKTVKELADKELKDPSVTPVTDPSNLTDAEKAKVAEEVKKSNPTVTDVKVDKDGTTTVTYPDGTTAVIPADKTVKELADKELKDPSVTPVTDPSNLTDAEKGKVAEEVKKSNPTVTDVKVDKDGTTTVTYPDGTTAVIPADKTVKKSADKDVKDPSVTPVTDPSNLTDAEKGKVAEEVKKSNPTVTDVKVDKDGTTTVTYPDGTTAVIPADKTVKKSADKVVTDPAVTPVTDPSNLTDAEKAKVADEVKKSNPTVSKVEVGNDGTTTVTYPDGTTAVIPSDKTVKKSSDKTVKDPSVTPVTDPSNLTDAEKAKVAEEVKKSNPTVTDVKVDKDGTTTVTYPDGTTAVIPADKTVKKSSDKVVTNPTVTPVVDPSNLTDAEKAKVAEEVKKANPTASKVEVGNDGTATVTFPDGSVAVLTPAKTVKSADSNGVKNPSVTPVTDPSNLTDAEKAKVAEEVKKANPTATDIKVNNDGSVVVTFADGSVAVIASEKAVKEATKESSSNPSAKKAGAKELPNTGTEQSNASVGLALLAAATGGLLFAKKRKEEE